MENQINIGDQNVQQVGQNPACQPVQIPEKPKYNYLLIPTLILVAILILVGLYLLNLKNSVKNTNQHQFPPTKGSSLKISENTSIPITTQPLAINYENQKYGNLADLSLKPDVGFYTWIARNPPLTDIEKGEIDKYFDIELKKIFTLNNNISDDFLNKYFRIRSFMWKPIYNGNMSPPDRKELKSLVLIVKYEFQFDWVKTTHFILPDKNGTEISLDLVFFDYNDNKFVEKETIIPSDLSKFLAFKDGVEKIISSDEAKKLIKNEMMKYTQNLPEDSLDYEQYLSVTGNKLVIGLQTANVRKLCAGSEKDTKDIKKVDAAFCNIDLSSTETHCDVKETYCSMRL